MKIISLKKSGMTKSRYIATLKDLRKTAQEAGDTRVAAEAYRSLLKLEK